MEQGQTNYGLMNVDASVLNRREQIDFNKYMQDMKQVIDDLDNFLASTRVEKDAKTGDWVKIKINDTPLMTEEGREFVKARLRSYLNPNLYMAQLSEKDAAHSFRLDIVNFGCDLYGSRVKYKMQRSSARRIISIIAPVMWFALRKSETDKKAIYDHMNSNNSNQGGGLGGVNWPMSGPKQQGGNIYG